MRPSIDSILCSRDCSTFFCSCSSLLSESLSRISWSAGTTSDLTASNLAISSLMFFSQFTSPFSLLCPLPVDPPPFIRPRFDVSVSSAVSMLLILSAMPITFCSVAASVSWIGTSSRLRMPCSLADTSTSSSMGPAMEVAAPFLRMSSAIMTASLLLVTTCPAIVAAVDSLSVSADATSMSMASASSSSEVERKPLYVGSSSSTVSQISSEAGVSPSSPSLDRSR